MHGYPRMKTKKFDCVEMMHRGAELVREKTKDMTLEEQIAYWQQQTDELRRLKQEIEKERNGGGSNGQT